jgi:hypothetical protein
MPMRVLETEPRSWEPASRRQQAERIETDSRLTESNGGVLVHVEGRPQILSTTDWGQDEHTLAQLARVLRFGVPFQNSTARLSGITSSAQYFGTVPPKPTHKRYACRDARLYELQPEVRPLVEAISGWAWQAFQRWMPEHAASHEQLVREHIHPDWLIAGTPFTSGIINDRSALAYHRDSGNLAGSWSMMVCLREWMAGGHLHLPEYDLTLDIADRSLTVFNGQRWWHGVTPMVYRRKDAYRYTLVWYVKDMIRHCACREQETARASVQATKIQDAYGS